MKDLFARVNELGYELVLDEKAKDFIAEKGYDPQFGARPLNRAIQKYLEDPLAEFILNNQESLEEGAKLTASLNDEDIEIVVAETGSSKKKKSKK